MSETLFYTVSALVNALVATVLAFVVYFRNRKQLVNKIFSLFFASVAIWSYSYFVWFLLKDKNLVLLNHRIFLMGAAIFIAILFFHSVLALTNKIKEYKKLLVAGYIIFSFFLVMDYFTPFIVKDMQGGLFSQFWPQPGVLFTPFLVAWYFYLIAVLYILIKEIKRISSFNSEVDKLYSIQLKYILIGAIVGFVGAVPNYLFWYSWYAIPIAQFTNFLVAIGMIIIAYGIVKYNLFNIKLLISEILVFSIWTLVIVRAVLSNNNQELLINSFLAFLVFMVGILLIRSLYKETELTKRLLDETQKNLDLEIGLRKEFIQKAGEVIKKMEEIVSDNNKRKQRR